MHILWEAEDSLMISEIVKREGGTIHSVQVVIKSLLKKGMVVVDGHAYNNKSLGRTFKAAVSSEIVEMNALQELFNSLVSKSIAASHLLASLLPSGNCKDDMDELDRLEEMIKERKRQILENQGLESQASENLAEE